MLIILNDLFDKLNDSKITWVLYKSYGDMIGDLKGERGDVDIFVNKENESKFEEVVLNSGFYKMKNQCGNVYYFGFDRIKKLAIVLDVSFGFIKFGIKPLKPRRLYLNLIRNELVFNGSYYTLPLDSYFAITCLLRGHKEYISQTDLTDLKLAKLSNYQTPSDVNILKHSEALKHVCNKTEIENWELFRKEYLIQLIPTKMEVFKNFILKVMLKIKFILTSKRYSFTNNGAIICFVGIDGSGKSSTIDMLKQNKLLELLPVKYAYLGNNNYLLPFCNSLVSIRSNRFFIRKLISSYVIADKWVRMAFVYGLKKLGFIVFVDRYFFDDEIGRSLLDNKKLLNKIYRKTIAPRPLIRPDLTVYLDISTEVAYKRKQDYSIEFMEKINRTYKNYFKKYNGHLATINANEDEATVKNNIINYILGYIRCL